MLNDCNYTKIRLLHDLSRIVWYLKKHAKKDAQKHRHDKCKKIYSRLEKDLNGYVEELKGQMIDVVKTGKMK